MSWSISDVVWITVFTVTVISGIVQGMNDIVESDWPVEVLAARSGLPVRTIREYQTMRVLQPPVRRGRVSFYSDAHLRRLALISRLQQRGYSLAAMRDLFEAWAAGQDLAAVLTDPDGMLVDEAPVVLDEDGLSAAVARVPVDRIAELIQMGVVIERGEGQYCLPSPSLLVLLDDAIANGISPEDAMRVAASIAHGAQTIADEVAAVMAALLEEQFPDDSTVHLLRRGRVLVAQATSRLLLHELGVALSNLADQAVDQSLAELVDRVRIGRDGTRSDGTQATTETGVSSHGQ